MVIKDAGKNLILVGIVMLALFFGIVGNVGAYIDTRDLGIDETQDTAGFIDFKNEVDNIFLEEDEEYNVTGVLTVYNDGTLVLKENITLEVISFHGFAVNRPDTREFNVNMTEGLHNLTAYIESEGQTVETVYEYEIYAVEEEEEVEEEIIDWLPCPSRKECE
jgi:hypothetical protein